MKDVSELQMLRTRLVTSAVEERRRFERALHDGVQQDLIGISVLLQLVRKLVPTAPDEALASLEEAQHAVRGALDRVRALASDIYPAILEARGLPDALRQAARASAAATSVETAELGRYPARIEAAVFFLWREVLDNLGAGENARIRLSEKADALQVKIETGTPVDPLRAGDLVESAGGTLTMRSGTNGCGVEAAFPLA